MGKFDIREHKKHYYVEMEGHTICPKCYAIKYMDEELARRDEEWRERIGSMPTVSEYYTQEMVGHPYNAQVVVTHEAISRENLLSTLLEDKQ